MVTFLVILVSISMCFLGGSYIYKSNREQSDFERDFTASVENELTGEDSSLGVGVIKEQVRGLNNLKEKSFDIRQEIENIRDKKRDLKNKRNLEAVNSELLNDELITKGRERVINSGENAEAF